MRKYELFIKNNFNMKFYYPIHIIERENGPTELTYMIRRDDILEFVGDARFGIEGEEYYVGRTDKEGSMFYRVKLLQV